MTVTVGGVPVDLTTRRTAALLAHLVCTGTPVSRALLAATFWPDRPEQRARGNLRVLLSNLRTAVAPVLDIQRTTVGLVPGARDGVDVHRFDDLADRALGRPGVPGDAGLLDAALHEYGGEFLQGLDFDGGPVFDTWVTAERTRLRLRALQVLEALVDLQLAETPTSRTIALAHRLRDLDPWRESSQERLMRAQWYTGDPAGALGTYERWLQGVEAEFGIQGSDDLHALAARIRQGAPPPVGHRVETHRFHQQPGAPGWPPDWRQVPGPSLRAEWPLVARDAELAVLAGVLGTPGQQPEPGPAGAVVVGPAGSGRTRLLREVEAEAHARGHEVAWILGTRATAAMPFAAIAQLLPEVEPDGYPDLAARHRACAAAIIERARGGRVVLLADDAHLLDGGTAALLLHLVAAGAATVVASLLPGHSDDDPITRIWKDGWGARVDLAPLAERDMGDLLAAGLGGEVDASARQSLIEVAGGNPELLRELVLGAVEAGSLREVGGGWCWDGRVVLAPRLLDAVEWRLKGLTHAQRQLLAIVALGEPVGLDLLERLTEGAAVAELEVRGLLVVERDDRRVHVRLGHPVCGEVVVDQLGEAGRRSLLRLLADHLAATGTNRPGDVIRAATWRLEAGMTGDAEQLTAAAEAANHAFDHDLAWRLAQAAIEAGGGPRSVLALAAAGNGSSRPDEVEAALAAHAQVLGSHDDVAVVRAYLFHRFRALHLGLGRAAATLAVLDAVATSPHGPDLEVLLEAYRAQVLRDTGQARQALACSMSVLRAPVPDPAALQLVEGTVFLACFDLGLTDRAREVARQVRERQADGSLPGVRHAALWATLHELACLVQEGQVTLALAGLEPLHRQLVSSPERNQRGVIGTFLGQCHLMGGNVDAAREVLADSVTAFEEADVLGTRTLALALLGQAEAAAGDVEAARRTQVAAHAHGGGRYRTRFALETAAMDVWVEAAAGRRDGAGRLALAAARGVGDRPGVEVPLLHLAVRLGADPVPIAERLVVLTAETDNPLLALYAAHARALAAGDADALRALAARYEEAGLRPLATESAAQVAAAGTFPERPDVRLRRRTSS